MSGYALRRLAHLLPLLLGLSIFSFALGQAAPGDPARVLLRRSQATPPTVEQVRALRKELGLDDPAVVQYGRWLHKAVTGDLGRSFSSGQTVLASLREALPVTVGLALLSFLLVVAVGVPVGVLAAVTRGRLGDHASRMLALAGASLPSFWIGLLLILVFAVHLHLFPTSGATSPASYVLPAVTLAAYATSVTMRLTRASMLDVLDEDFLRAARARGIPGWRVVLRHALRVAVNPVVTYAGLVFGGLLGGAVVVETVFAMPGIGKLVVDAIHARDFPMVQGFVLLFGTVILFVNLGVDLLYALLDPRVRLADDRGSLRGR